MTDRRRFRLRFRKQDDLRWISHRDLVRVFERTFRRASLPLRMSEGFHPKPRMSFPSALGLGIEGSNEVMEFELCQDCDPAALQQRIAEQAPAGLRIDEVQRLGPQQGKAKLRRMTYEIAIPAERRGAVQERIHQLSAQATYSIQREGRAEPLELKAALDLLELRGGVIRFRLRADTAGAVRPREVLQALGIDDLERQGSHLIRSQVEISP